MLRACRPSVDVALRARLLRQQKGLIARSCDRLTANGRPLFPVGCCHTAIAYGSVIEVLLLHCIAIDIIADTAVSELRLLLYTAVAARLMLTRGGVDAAAPPRWRVCTAYCLRRVR